KQKKLIMLPSETMIWQPEFTDKTLSEETRGRFRAMLLRLILDSSMVRSLPPAMPCQTVLLQ
ncbi:hypothetical protein, partial [Escherichia coli]|uniref:hypothetical protein n=1 Tax=Escherichia coli TaxID=562 RepID=UPI001BFC481D